MKAEVRVGSELSDAFEVKNDLRFNICFSAMASF